MKILTMPEQHKLIASLIISIAAIGVFFSLPIYLLHSIEYSILLKPTPDNIKLVAFIKSCIDKYFVIGGMAFIVTCGVLTYNFIQFKNSSISLFKKLATLINYKTTPENNTQEEQDNILLSIKSKLHDAQYLLAILKVYPEPRIICSIQHNYKIIAASDVTSNFLIYNSGGHIDKTQKLIGTSILLFFPNLRGIFENEVVERQIHKSNVNMSSDIYEQRIKKVVDSASGETFLVIEWHKVTDKISTIKNFEEKLTKVIDSVSSIASKLHIDANNLARYMQSTSSQSIKVAKSAEDTTSNMRDLSQSTNELYQTINQINEKATESSQITNDALQDAQKAASITQLLFNSAQQMNEIIDLIQNIIKKTNILALNARIESAHAGEYGKGFAIVADEVKTLANQSSQAASDIGAQIEEVRVGIGNVRQNTSKILETISKMQTLSHEVAGNVDAQKSSAIIIVKNIASVSLNCDNVLNHIKEIAVVANDSEAMAIDMLASANLLQAQVADLKSASSTYIEAQKAI